MKQRGIFEKISDSGIWWVRYADSTGHIRREKAGTKSAAVALYHRRKTEVLQRAKLPESLRRRSISFTEIAQDAEKYSKVKHRPHMHDNVRVQTRKLLEWFGDRSADSILPSEIERRLSEHAVTPATFNRYRSNLSLIYKLAMQDKKVTTNPARLVGQRRENNARLRFLSAEEETALRKSIREHCPKREREFELALHTGMRRSEQYGLCWSGVRFDLGLITIPRSKHGEARHIPINSAARTALVALLKDRQGQADFVCPGGMGKKGYGDRWFFDCAKKAGVVGIVWHSLRHTFISRLAMKGTDFRTLQEVAGWKSLAMVMRYAHLSPSHLQEAVERLVSTERTDTKTDTSQIEPQITGSRFVN